MKGKSLKALGVILGALFVFVSAVDSVSADNIIWRRSYGEALKEAREQRRPLLVKVSSRFCIHCTRMQANTLSNQQVVDEVSENFVALELDAEADRELVSKLRVSIYPTTIVVDPSDRKILSRIPGYQDSIQYTTRLQKALESSSTNAR